jgi:hypothetical protein
MSEFIQAYNDLARKAHETSTDKGWWKEKNALSETPRGAAAIDAEFIALCHSELSEALENMRHGYVPDDKIPEFSGVEAELADVIIRFMDHSHARGWRVAEAVVAKMAMNTTRPAMHGGKGF